MKRMIFIRIALPALLVVAAMTFMGTVSVSAQSYFTPGQALAVTEATLDQLSQTSITKAAPSNANLIGAAANTAQAPTVNNNSLLLVLEIAYLTDVQTNLKLGEGTQQAIDSVYNNLAPNASGARIVLLGTVKAYVVDLLSN